MARQVGVVGGVDEIVRHRLVHVVAEVELAGRHDVVVLGEQVAQEALEGELAAAGVVLVGLVEGDEVLGAGRVRVRVQDLVEPGVALRLVQEVHELVRRHHLLRIHARTSFVSTQTVTSARYG